MMDTPRRKRTDGDFLSWGWPGILALVWILWTGLVFGDIENEWARRALRLFLFGFVDFLATMICLHYGTRALCLPGRFVAARSLAGVIDIAAGLVIVWIAFGPVRGRF